MLHRLIKTWTFDNKDRDSINFVSSLIRLNSERSSVLQLKEQGKDTEKRDIYSTASDLYVRSKQFEPQALQSWLMFDVDWGTTEPEFKEYPMVLSDKVGSVFTRDAGNHLPRVGDKVFQGDHETSILSMTEDTITLVDGTDFVNGNVYCLRSECEVNFRLNNGTNSYYHNGTDWVIAGASNWNTIYQINNNIDSLSISTFSKKLSFDINLKTNNKLYTPYIKEIKTLGRFEIDFTEDIIFDSMMKSFEDNLNVTTTVGIYLASSTDTINLGTDYKLDNDGYNFIGDDCVVYNLTTDPMRLVNLFSSYTNGTARKGGGYDAGIITLSAAQTTDDELEIRIRYIPELATNTSIDFYEINRTPSIVFERIEKRDNAISSDAILGKDVVKDKLNLNGVQLEQAIQNDLIFDYAVFTGNQTDQHRLSEALQRFFNSERFVTSWGLDTPYNIIVDSIFRSTNTPNLSDINTHVGKFTIKNVVTQIREPSNVSLTNYLTNQCNTN